MTSSRKGEQRVVLSGIGQSDVGRRLGRADLDLTIDSCLAAIEDAGLTRDDIDGLVGWPGPGPFTPGFAGPGVGVMQKTLRLGLNYYASGMEVAGQLGALLTACNAVGAGMANHALVYRTVTEGSARAIADTTLNDATAEAVPWLQWGLPYNLVSPANFVALQAQRHIARYGLTRAHLGAIVTHCRKMAGLNPRAIYREPMTLADYFGARMISEPLAMFDCDVPCDGSTAFVVSAAECVDDLRHPVRIEAVGAASMSGPVWEYGDDLDESTVLSAAAHMWSRTDLKPGDVDVAEIYDGFSYLVVAWLEALFCGIGGGADYIGDGSLFALDGQLPLNTDGGQLSAGRLHGFAKVHEAVLQLRGEAHGRQVSDADVAVVSAGALSGAAALLLTR